MIKKSCGNEMCINPNHLYSTMKLKRFNDKKVQRNLHDYKNFKISPPQIIDKQTKKQNNVPLDGEKDFNWSFLNRSPPEDVDETILYITKKLLKEMETDGCSHYKNKENNDISDNNLPSGSKYDMTKENSKKMCDQCKYLGNFLLKNMEDQVSRSESNSFFNFYIMI